MSGLASQTMTDLVAQIAKRKSAYDLYFKEIASARMLCVAFMVGVLVAILAHKLIMYFCINKDGGDYANNEILTKKDDGKDIERCAHSK